MRDICKIQDRASTKVKNWKGIWMLWKRHRSVGLDSHGMNQKKKKKKAARKLQALTQNKENETAQQKYCSWVLMIRVQTLFH